jgi:hypothetical protein
LPKMPSDYQPDVPQVGAVWEGIPIRGEQVLDGSGAGPSCREYSGGPNDIDHGEEFTAERVMHQSRNIGIETDGVDQDAANGNLDMPRLLLGV